MKQIILLPFIFTIVLTSCSPKNKNTTSTNSTSDILNPKAKIIEPVLLPRFKNPLLKPDKLDSTGNIIDNGKKKIYLTFDDGPNQGTRIVMDILKQENVPATFYMIGLHRYGSPLQGKLWNEVNKEPTFEVVNHSFTHAYRNNFAKFYNDVDGAVNDFVKTNDSLKFNNKIIRAPGSNVWRLKETYIDHKYEQRTQIMDSLFKLGYFITGWDWEWSFDHKTQKTIQSPDKLITEINSLFKTQHVNKANHLVLLAHDYVYADTADAARLKEFIVKLKTDPNFEFRVISQYPGAGESFIKPKD